MTTPALLVTDVPLGPDARLQLTAIPDPNGALVMLRVWRASPADTSAGRFRPTGEVVVVPIAAFKLMQLELAKVGQAASDFEFRRPWPGHDATTIPDRRPHATD